MQKNEFVQVLIDVFQCLLCKTQVRALRNVVSDVLSL